MTYVKQYEFGVNINGGNMTPCFFQIVRENKNQGYFIPGQWVFFECMNDGKRKYWLMQTYRDAYVFGFSYPISLREGISFLRTKNRIYNTRGG